MKRTEYKKSRTHTGTAFVLLLTVVMFSTVISCKSQEPVQKVYTLEEKGVTAPEVLESPNPAYTEEARSAKVEGIVTLKAVVRKDGRVDNFRVVDGLGYGLDESAIRAIATKWRFKPATYEGRPVDFQADFEVAFQIY